MRTLLGALAGLMLVALTSTAARSVVVGQIDTFEDGTTEGWFAGLLGQTPPIPPTVVGTGGPAGAGDAFLEITAVGGSGPGSRLAVINDARWAGDYVAAGVRRIEMDLRNLGTTDLTIRLLLEGPLVGPVFDKAVTSLAAVLPAGSGWTHFVLPIGAGDLTALQGSAMAALEDTTWLRIIHAPAVGGAVPVVGVLGVDNLAATPAPAALVLAATGLVVLAGARARRRPAGLVGLPLRR